MKKAKKITPLRIAIYAVYAFAIYFSVCMTILAFANPELTRTQLALRCWDALCWRF